MKKVKEVGNESIFLCPFCPSYDPDTSGHLYVNFVKGVYNCFRCNASGKVKDLKKLLKLEFIDSPSLSLLKKRLRSLKKPDFEKLTLPSDYKLVKREVCSEAYEYLTRKRGFTDSHIEYWYLGVTSLDNFGTIWFPDFDNSMNLVYYQRRKYKPKDKDNSRVPRWRNPKKEVYGVHKNALVYNYSRVKNEEIIYVVEGPTSAVSMGVNSCATYSKNWSEVQSLLLGSTKAKKIYILFDGEDDAYTKSVELAEKISMMGRSVYTVKLPEGEDPDSVSDKDLKYCIAHEFEEFTPSLRSIVERNLEKI